MSVRLDKHRKLGKNAIKNNQVRYKGLMTFTRTLTVILMGFVSFPGSTPVFFPVFGKTL